MADTNQNESSVIVVRVNSGHPTGNYSRAGHRFSKHPTAVRVTAEQRKTLESDQFLKVYTEGDTFDTAMESEPVDLTQPNGAQQQEVARKNEVAYASGDAVPGNENKVMDNDDATGSSNASDDAGNDGATEKGKGMNKSEIIDALKAQGLEEGKDFDPAATKDVLKQLLQ